MNSYYWIKLLDIGISAIISSNTINTLRFVPGLYSSIFPLTFCISFEYSKNALESFTCFAPTSFHFLIKNWYFVSYGFLA